MVLLLAIAMLLAVDPQRPLPVDAPDAVAPSGLRVHIRASEDLEVDRLRAFARPGVTLWLLTRSNGLKASMLENLNRFDAAFVQLHAPITLEHIRALEKAPRAGVWITAAALDEVGRLRGPRPLAIDITGPLDEALAGRLAALKPALIDWAVPASPDVLSWGLFRGLPGKKLVSTERGLPCAERVGREPAAHVNIGSLLELSTDAFPCGPGPRITITADTDLWLVQSIVVRDPTAELELNVGDDAQAKKVAALLDHLGMGGKR